MSTRIERDAMGEVAVPADRLWGAATQRAVENFPISGRPLPPGLIHALARIKLAAARANRSLGLLDARVADLIARAAAEVAEGRLDEHFPVDVFQTGSGTSSNMNVNEVIANRAAQLAGEPVGRKAPVHPNDHVNRGQSSNDVFPSAIHCAALAGIAALDPALARLEDRLQEKALAWREVVAIGRTHLQDAVPVTLGQVFGGYATQIAHARVRLEEARPWLCELPLGGTAVGTGLATHPEFAARVCAELRVLTGQPVREAQDHFACQGARDGIAACSAALRGVALALARIANDVRWRASGPRCGLGELRLPAVQPGSSIMPGKVNPVICEAVIQVAAQVLANDTAVALGDCAGIGSLLELNVAMPLLARNLLESIALLTSAARGLDERAIAGLEADEARCAEQVERSLALVTALVPAIGYDRAGAIAQEAHRTGRTLREVALAQGVLPAAELDRLLDPRRMLAPDPALGGEG